MALVRLGLFFAKMKWWRMPVTPAIGRLIQEDCRFEISLNYTVRPYLKEETTSKTFQAASQRPGHEVTCPGLFIWKKSRDLNPCSQACQAPVAVVCSCCALLGAPLATALTQPFCPQERQDKVVLQSEVASLRQNNQRLQEESQAASEQLRKFAELFSREKKEL